ncbi:MAG: DUF1080 domain-containing protein [Balneolales bacterium]
MKILNYRSLKSLLLLLFVGGLIASCQTGDERTGGNGSMNTLTDAEKEDGWELIFDGQSTQGWRGYQQSSFPEGGWMVEDGTLRCIGTGMGEAGGQGGDIIYDEKFMNFTLQLEWKISEGGNSGIFYLGRELEGEPIWKTAPEMQILDNDKHPDARLGVDGNRQAGSLYDLIPANPQNTKPAGEWNHIEIMVYRGTVVHSQNGEVVLEYHLGTSDWDNMIANSKFQEFSEFGKFEPGYIALQDHGDDVWFRNIKIKKM